MAKLTSSPSRLWLTASSTTLPPIRRRRYPWLSSPKPCTRRCARAFHRAYLQFCMHGIRMTTGSLMASWFPPGRLQLSRLTPPRHRRFLAITMPHPCCDVRRRSRTRRTSRLRVSRLRASPSRRLRRHRPQLLLEQQPVRRLLPVRSLLPKIKTIPSCAEAFRREPLSRKKSRLLLTNRLLLLQRRNLLARRALFS